MMFDDIITLYNTLWLLLDVLVGFFITYHISRKLANDNVRKESNRRLRESFSGEQAYMVASYHKKVAYQNDVHYRLIDTIERPHRAVIEHMHHLNDNKKRALQIAWNDYELGVVGHEYEFRGTKGNAPKEIFDERVAAILKFAAD